MSTVTYERYNPDLHDIPAGPVPRRSTRTVHGKNQRTRVQSKPGRRNRELTPRKFFTILIVVLTAAVTLEVVFHLVVSPRLRIDHVRIDPGRGVEVSEETVLQTAGLTGKIHYFDVDPDEIARKLMAIPFIRDVSVERSFPNTLSISITQRQAVAAILVDVNDAAIPALIDREGVLFRFGAGTVEGLPVISGVRFESPKPGMVLPEVLIRFLEDIEEIKRTSPVLLTLISEFKFIKKDGSRYEVLMYPEHYRVPVRIGDRLDERTLNYILMVLDVVLRQGMSDGLEEIDFRSGDVAFRKREG